MNIYFDKYNKGYSCSIHALDKWIDFRLHRIWAVHYYAGHNMRSVFFGPLMVTVGW